MTPEQVVKIALDIGESMLKCGAETVRVEDTITRICTAYYPGRLDVTSYFNAIFVSLDPNISEKSDYPVVTQHRRVLSIAINLTALEELNTLSRFICSSKPTFSESRLRLNKIVNLTPSLRKLLIGYTLSAAAFCIFFGGTLLDALLCGVIGLILFILEHLLSKRMNIQIIHTFVLSFVCGLLACLLHLSPLPINMDAIMIGNVMLLIPGVALTNALRELMIGDLISGSLKLLNSLMIATTIAAGFVLSMVLIGV
ncbi:MAG: threonine/serine exporter family protein [Lachnospiraceae bacterium]